MSSINQTKQTISDAALWLSFKEGSEEAFREMYDLYYDDLYTYGCRLSGDDGLVKDTIHDLFVKLWRNKNNLSEINSLKSYLLIALRGNILNAKIRAKRVVNGDCKVLDSFLFDFSPELTHIEKETEKNRLLLVKNALSTLTPRQKEILYLRYFQNMSYEEIATIMELSVKAAYKLNARALEALKEALPFLVTILVLYGNLY